MYMCTYVGVGVCVRVCVHLFSVCDFSFFIEFCYSVVKYPAAIYFDQGINILLSILSSNYKILKCFQAKNNREKRFLQKTNR